MFFFQKSRLKTNTPKRELRVEKRLFSNWKFDKRSVDPLERLQKSHKTKKGILFLALSDVLKKIVWSKGTPSLIKMLTAWKKRFASLRGFLLGFRETFSRE